MKDKDLFDKSLTLVSKIVCPILGIQSYHNIKSKELEFSVIDDKELNEHFELVEEKPKLEAYPPNQNPGQDLRQEKLGFPLNLKGEPKNIKSEEKLVLMAESIDNNVGFKKYPY